MKRRKSEYYFEELGDRFNEWSSLYDALRRVELIKKLLPLDASDRSCLEVGCGFGRISRAIFPLVKSLTVTDLSEKLAESVGNRLGTAWKREDACCLDLPDRSFDLVVSSECIEHTPDPYAAIAEMARVCAKGGTVIVTSPNRLWFPVVWLSMALRIRKFYGNEMFLFPGEAARVLRANGCSQVRIGGCHLFPFQLPFAKKLLPFFDRFDALLYPLMFNYGVGGRKG